jgi:hypothetical protein
VIEENKEVLYPNFPQQITSAIQGVPHSCCQSKVHLKSKVQTSIGGQIVSENSHVCLLVIGMTTLSSLRV